MAFPILKHLALSKDPITPYTIEKTKLEVLRNGKIEKTWIDKPTIFKALKLLEEVRLIRAAEQKECRDGRIRKKYVVTPQGVVALLRAYPIHCTFSWQDVRNLAERQMAFLPVIFGKWNYFRQQQVEKIAFKSLFYYPSHVGPDWTGMLADMSERKSLATASSILQSRWWRLLSAECVLRHGIYGMMLVEAYGFADASPRDTPWLRIIRGDAELLEMARKELLRLRLEDEMDDATAYYDRVSKALDGGEWPPPVTDRVWDRDRMQDDAREVRAMYRYLVASQIDEGKTPKSFGDVREQLVKEFLDRRTCPKCGQINGTSSFQLAKPCEKCGTRLDPAQLNR